MPCVLLVSELHQYRVRRSIGLCVWIFTFELGVGQCLFLFAFFIRFTRRLTERRSQEVCVRISPLKPIRTCPWRQKCSPAVPVCNRAASELCNLRNAINSRASSLSSIEPLWQYQRHLQTLLRFASCIRNTKYHEIYR